MNKRKTLKELNLLDKFLFDEAMDDPENVKTMLDIILSQNTNLKHSPQTEKEQRTFTDNRQIRLDVYAIDEDEKRELLKKLSDKFSVKQLFTY